MGEEPGGAGRGSRAGRRRPGEQPLAPAPLPGTAAAGQRQPGVPGAVPPGEQTGESCQPRGGRALAPAGKEHKAARLRKAAFICIPLGRSGVPPPSSAPLQPARVTGEQKTYSG